MNRKADPYHLPAWTLYPGTWCPATLLDTCKTNDAIVCELDLGFREACENGCGPATCAETGPYSTGGAAPSCESRWDEDEDCNDLSLAVGLADAGLLKPVRAWS